MQATSSGQAPLKNTSVTIVGFVAFTFIGYFTIGLSLGVLPVFIHQQLGYSAVVTGIVISLQYIVTFLLRGYGGSVVDKKGPKPAVMLSMVGFAASSVLLLLALLLKGSPVACISILIVARLVAGFGEGLIGASPVSWALLVVGQGHTGRAISYNGIASFGALAIGAPVGIFVSNSIGITGIGVLAAAMALLGLLYASNKQPLKQNSKAPREPFGKVLKTVAPYGICLTLSGLGFGTISTFITLYYAYLHWANAVLCLTFFSTLFILGRVFFGSAIDKFGGIRTTMCCIAVECVGLLVLWMATSPNGALLGAAIAGLGFSLVFPALGVEAVRLVPMSSKGSALGGYGLFLDVSLFITGPLVGGVASHFGLLYIFPFSVAMVFAGLLLAVLLYAQRKKLPVA